MARRCDENESSPLPDPLKPNWCWRTIQYILRLVFTIWLGFRVRGMHRVPTSGGGLFLMNHQSVLDPLLAQMGIDRPISWLGRDSLFRIPVIRWILRMTYVIPIKRESAGTSTIREGVRRMQHGFIVGIYPEGTRTRDGSVGEFKPGFVALIRRGNVPVFPVGIAGAHRALPRRAWFLRLCRVRVVIGEPFTAEEVKQLGQRGKEKELIAVARERVIRCQQAAERWRRGGN